MRKAVNIGILGDYEPDRASHIATIEAIQHAADKLSLEPDISWISTPSVLSGEGEQKLRQADYIWASPGTHKSLSGVIQGIRLARESGRPFIGT
jgi:CTP synthase (UTP-ammonia lyase)